MACKSRERSVQRSSNQDGQDRYARASGTIRHIATSTTRMLILPRHMARWGRCQFHSIPMITIHRQLHRCHVAIFAFCDGPGTDDRQGNQCNHKPRQKTCLHKCFQVCSQSYHLIDSCPIAGSHNREPNTHYARERKVPQKFDKSCEKRVRIAMTNCDSRAPPQPIPHTAKCAKCRVTLTTERPALSR
jgi:hypothetical protein